MKKTVEILAAVFMIVLGGKRESDLIHMLVEERTR
jgi:hypothetical protein